MQKKSKKKAKGKIVKEPSARRKAPPRPAQSRAVPSKRAKPVAKAQKPKAHKAKKKR